MGSVCVCVREKRHSEDMTRGSKPEGGGGMRASIRDHYAKSNNKLAQMTNRLSHTRARGQRALRHPSSLNNPAHQGRRAQSTAKHTKRTQKRLHALPRRRAQGKQNRKKK